MTAVVVLNASFEPLGVVTLKRAMAYLVRERAVVVEAVPGATYRAATAEFPVPRVVQFKTMVRVPYRYGVQPWSRRGVLERDGHRCAFCLKRAATVDHVMPKSRLPKGAADSWGNTVSACFSCNGRKANRTPEEARMPLLFQPREVTTRDTLLIAIAHTGADMAKLGFA